MKNQLKTYVLRTLLLEKPENISEEVYQKVISYIADYTHEICSYIFRCVEYDCLQEKTTLNDQNILSKLTSSYCFAKAYEYLQYLENEHEYAHEFEELAR